MEHRFGHDLNARLVFIAIIFLAAVVLPSKVWSCSITPQQLKEPIPPFGGSMQQWLASAESIVVLRVQNLSDPTDNGIGSCSGHYTYTANVEVVEQLKGSIPDTEFTFSSERHMDEYRVSETDIQSCHSRFSPFWSHFDPYSFWHDFDHNCGIETVFAAGGTYLLVSHAYRKPGDYNRHHVRIHPQSDDWLIGVKNMLADPDRQHPFSIDVIDYLKSATTTVVFTADDMCLPSAPVYFESLSGEDIHPSAVHLSKFVGLDGCERGAAFVGIAIRELDSGSVSPDLVWKGFLVRDGHVDIQGLGDAWDLRDPTSLMDPQIEITGTTRFEFGEFVERMQETPSMTWAPVQ